MCGTDPAVYVAAGMGVVRMIHQGMVLQGLGEEEAYNRFWMLDKDGLVTGARRPKPEMVVR